MSSFSSYSGANLCSALKTEVQRALYGVYAQALKGDLYGNIWLARMGGDEFLAALLASPRFMGLDVDFYINEVSNHFEKQFSAITFFLPDET